MTDGHASLPGRAPAPVPAGWLPAALAAVRADRVVAIARGLIDAHSPTGSERPAAEALQALLAEGNVAATLDPFASRRANLLAGVGGGAGPHLLLCGHLDTTGYGDERDRGWLHELTPSDLPISRLEDGVVSGLGAYNMKGGVAAAAEALLALAAVAPRLAGRVSLAAVAGESEKAPVRGLVRDYAGQDYEGGGVGAERLLEAGSPLAAAGARPDGVVICEPSGLAVVNAQPGYVAVRIRILGRAGYLPAPGTPTVVTALAGAVDAIGAWGRTFAERAALDCGLGTLRPTCTIGAVESGAPFKPGGTPSVGALYVDVRIPPGVDADPVVDELVAAARVAARGSFTVDAEVVARNLPGVMIPAGHPLVVAAQAARSAVLGRPAEAAPDWDFVPGDDGKVFARHGIPYVKVGPGSPTTRDARFGREQVRADELEQAARLYVELAARVLSGSRG